MLGLVLSTRLWGAGAPAFTTSNPTPVAVEAPGSLFVYVPLVDTSNVTYQWYKDGVALAGRTFISLDINPSAPSDSGQYTVKATNSFGSTTSAPVSATVFPPMAPLFLSQPVTASRPPGWTNTFAVSAISSTGSPSYQWFRNGSPIPGATTNSYMATTGTEQETPAIYTLQVFDGNGSTFSNPVQIIPLPPAPPVFTDNAPVYRMTSGGFLSINLYPVQLAGTFPMTYQWYRDGTAIPGATSSAFSKYPVSSADAGTYRLVATNSLGSAFVDVPVKVDLPGAPWLAAQRVGDVVYFLAAAPGRIMRYDLAQETWLPVVNLTAGKTPTAFCPTESGAFIAYGKDLVWRPADLQSETAVTTETADITNMVQAGDLVLYWWYGVASVPSRRVSTQAAGPSVGYFYYGLDRTTRPAYCPATRELFLVNRGPDFYRVAFAADGTPSIGSSRHIFSDFSVGDQLDVTADGQRVYSHQGNIFQRSDLGYLGTTGASYDRMDFFPDGAPVMLRGHELQVLDPASSLEQGRYVIPEEISEVFARGDKVFAFGQGDTVAANPVTVAVPRAALVLPVPAAVGIPASRHHSVDYAFIDGGGVVNVVSQSLRGITRWSTATRTFQPSVTLRAEPQQFSFAPAANRLMLSYPDGTMTKLDLDSGTAEQPFVRIPVANDKRGLLAMDDLAYVALKEVGTSGDFRMIYGVDGSLKRVSSGSYWGNHFAWQSGPRRVYYTPQASYEIPIQSVTVSADGQLEDTYFAKYSPRKVVAPLSFSADSAYALSANGRILTDELAYVGTLPEPVVDGAWLAGGLYSIKAAPTGTEIKKWSRADYSLAASITVAGMPLRIFRIDDTKLVVLTLVDGYLAYHVVPASLASKESYYTSPVGGALPTVLVAPQALFPNAGETATFQVTATGSGPLTYQWRRNGVNLADGGRIAGATSATLTIAGVQFNNAGSYDVVISNSAGPVTTSAVSLGVFEVAGAGITKFSAGRYHSLRLDGLSRFYATGTNAYGQLGNGNTTMTNTAQPVTLAGQTIVDLSAGAEHSLILTSAREAWAAGLNSNGQLGDGTTTPRSTPVKVATDVVGLAAGRFHSAFLKSDGTLWTVGGNDEGQLGDGTMTDRAAAVQIASGVADLAVGLRQTLFVKSDGTLWGVGDLYGNGTLTSTPVQIATGVKAVAAGGYHSIFVKTDGTVWTLGYNPYGQLGNGGTATATTPVQVATGGKAVAAGYFFSLFLKADNTLWGMGYNNFGQLGDGTNANRLTPYQMTTGVTAMSASEGYTLFRRIDDTLWATGLNGNGQFGNESYTTVSTPVQIAGGIGLAPEAPAGPIATTPASGDRVHLAWDPTVNASNYEVWRGTTNDSNTATRIAQDVRWSVHEDLTAAPGVTYYYWIKAVNAKGRSGFSPSVAGSFNPPGFPGITVLSPARQVLAPGQALNLSVTATGPGSLAYQWYRNGRSISGATGSSLSVPTVAYQDSGWYVVDVTNGTGTTRSAPRFVIVAPATTGVVTWGSPLPGVAQPALTETVAISGGGGHMLALQSDGHVRGWGYGDAFQPIPAAASELVAVAAGAGFSLAIKSDATVVLWSNFTKLVPAGLTNIVGIAAGEYEAYALRSDGTVIAWDTNTGGPLGPGLTPGLTDVVAITRRYALKSDGTVVSLYTLGEAPPSWLASVATIATGRGGYHTIAIKSDGTAVGWGYSTDGQAAIPSGAAPVVGAAGGDYHSVLLKADGTVLAWGGNVFGQTDVPAGLNHVIAVSAGTNFSAALRDATDDATPSAPVITAQPSNQTVAEGTNATFVVAASGAPAPTYQWQRRPAGGTWTSLANGGAFSGASTASLLITSATVAIDGDQFRCVATNSSGSVTSSGAVLTVSAAVPVTSHGNAITYGTTTFPATAAAGASVTFTYNVTNSGAQAWGADHHLSLRTGNGGYLTFPSINGVAAGGGSTVASFTFTAPSTPGVYTYYVEAQQDGVEYFGRPMALTLTVPTATSSHGNGINYGMTTFPATAAAGASVTFTYNVTNAGTQAWGADHHLSLRTGNGAYLTFPSLNGVAAGGSTAASFTFTTPAAPGVYIYYVEAQQDGVEFFGLPIALKLTVPRSVTGQGNGISYGMTTFPATAAPGAAVTFSYSVTNSGTQAWGADHHLSLRTSNGTYLTFPSLNGVAAGAGMIASFTFTAPATPGVYTYYVEALQDGVEFFGLPIALTLTVPTAVTSHGNGISYGQTTFPATASAGTAITFTYGVTNTGTQAWGADHHLSLRTSDGTFLTFPSLNGVAAGSGTIASFTFTAPATPGVYTYYVEALQDGVEVFGLPIVLTLTVPTSATSHGNGIEYGMNTFPATAAAGAAVTFTYNVTNTGTQAWGADHHLSLRTSNGSYLTFPSLNGVAAGGGTIASFTFTAPTTPGVYTYYVEALQDGVEFFGLPIAFTLTVPVAVSGHGNAITYGLTTFPATAAPGAAVTFTYSVTNTGTQAWGADHHLSLRNGNGTYLTFPSLGGVAVGGGTIASFTFTAPATPGIYTYYVEALQDGVEFFGLPIALTLTVPRSVTGHGNAIGYGLTTFPATAAPGAAVTFTYSVTNTGAQAWGADHHLSLRTSGGSYLTYPSLNGVAVGGGKIASFLFTAPATPGVYTYYVEAQQDGVEVFGLPIALTLTVPAPVTGQGNAISYGMTTFPASATAGAAVTFTYSVANTGTQAWGVDHHLSLRTSGGTYLTYPSLNGVAAGGGKIASFTFTAPASAGTYTYYVEAQQDGVEVFGLPMTLSLTVP